MRFGPLSGMLAAAALAVAGCSRAAGPDDTDLLALVESIGQQEITRSPEQASRLGIPAAVFGRPYNALLDDRSIAASQRARAQRLEALRELETIDRAWLTRDGQRLLDTVLASYESAIDVDRFGYGHVSLGWASPYMISQNDGAYVDIIKLLTSNHPVRSRADAEAWLARLGIAADAIRDELRSFEIDVEFGGAPPRRILQRTLSRVLSYQTDDPREHILARYLAESLSQIPDIPEPEITRLLDEAARIIEEELDPAYDELAAYLMSLTGTASDDPGVWRLRNGGAYYEAALRLYTSTDFTPRQVHDIGLALVDDITARVDEAMIEIGFEEGTVGERYKILAADPEFHYPQTPEGETAMLDDIKARIRWAETNLARIVSVGPAGDVGLRAAPSHAHATAPLAYYKPVSVDGQRQAAYTLNLQALEGAPSWVLPTLTFHEAVPGHHLQAGLAREANGQPVLLTLISNIAFSEGWAVYAEDLAAEMEAYGGEPEAWLGYMQAILFRAARMVADTGIHSERWSHAQAVDYLVATTGLPRASMENEVDRYTIRPGHAAAYMIGREKIRNLRGDVDIELGPDFSLVTFHDIILRYGARPLDVMEADVRDWAASVVEARLAQTSPR